MGLFLKHLYCDRSINNSVKCTFSFMNKQSTWWQMAQQQRAVDVQSAPNSENSNPENVLQWRVRIYFVRFAFAIKKRHWCVDC